MPPPVVAEVIRHALDVFPDGQTEIRTAWWRDAEGRLQLVVVKSGPGFIKCFGSGTP
jgi:hypothetical protein